MLTLHGMLRNCFRSQRHGTITAEPMQRFQFAACSDSEDGAAGATSAVVAAPLGRYPVEIAVGALHRRWQGKEAVSAVRLGSFLASTIPKI